MLLEKRIEAFAALGQFLSQFGPETIQKKQDIPFNELFFEAFEMQTKRVSEANGWFTQDNVLYALFNWSIQLNKNTLKLWTSSYNLNKTIPKTVAIIMAGNIPLVGFHDFLSVLLSGNKVLVKQSSNDKHFLPLIAKYLEYIAPEFKGSIQFTEDKLTGFHATIATGSNNTARYFEYYFGKYPNIIRKNRNSVAVLTGNETQDELLGLAEDMLRYFGLGCRSVSKIYVPKNYDFDQLFKAIYPYGDIIHYKKYQNNYDYNKAVYLMSEFKLVENGFLMLKEDASYTSPIATVFYEFYDNLDHINQRLQNDAEMIQCVVSNAIENAVDFGKTQEPGLSDYADGIDTLAFLSNL